MTTIRQTATASIAKQPRANRSWNGYAVIPQTMAHAHYGILTDGGYDGSTKASKIFYDD